MSTATKLISASGGGKDPNAFMDAISIVSRVYNGSTYRTNVILTSDAFGWGNPSGIYDDAWSYKNLTSSNDPNDPFTVGALDYSTGQWAMQGYWGSTLYYDGSSLQTATMPGGTPDYEGPYFAAGKNNAFYNTNWSSRSVLAAYDLADWNDAADWSAEASLSGYNHNMVVLDDGTAVVVKSANGGPTYAYTKTGGTGTTWSTNTIVSNTGTTTGRIIGNRTKFYYLMGGKIYTSTNGTSWTDEGTNTLFATPTSYGKPTAGVPKYDYVNDRWVYSTSSTTYISTDLDTETTLFSNPSLTGTSLINAIPLSTGDFVFISTSNSSSNPGFYFQLVNSSGTVEDTLTINPVTSGYYPSQTYGDPFLTRDYNRVNFGG